MGTYSEDRQPALERLLCEPARLWPEGRFAVAGPQYPRRLGWPSNVRRITHLAPTRHRSFYTSQRFTLNITRAAMLRAGWSPSVRLFEAAACGAAIISDRWSGLEAFFVPGRDILLAQRASDILGYLREMDEGERRRIGRNARRRILERHTSSHRAAELEAYALEALGRLAPRPAIFPPRERAASEPAAVPRLE